MIEEITLKDFQVFFTELHENLLGLENGISDLFHVTTDDILPFLD